MLWEFIKEHSFPSDMSSGPVPPAPDRVVLHLYCALHSSLGSICKGKGIFILKFHNYLIYSTEGFAFM